MRGAGRLAATAFVSLAILAAGIFAPHPAAHEIVTAGAVLRPDRGFLTRFHAQCDGRAGTAFVACFVSMMAGSGASRAALDFTRRLDNQAYLEALDPTPGPIAIAHVFYPFRANENNGWLLVNGAPPLINVDDRSNLPLGEMRSSPSYQAIHGHYPNVAFWPGDRGAAAPEFSPDGREITVGYWLRDFCHACAIVGHVRFAFDFAASGRFLGARLVSVIPAGQG